MCPICSTKKDYSACDSNFYSSDILLKDAKEILTDQLLADDWVDALSILWDYGYKVDEVYDMPVMMCAFENDFSKLDWSTIPSTLMGCSKGLTCHITTVG